MAFVRSRRVARFSSLCWSILLVGAPPVSGQAEPSGPREGLGPVDFGVSCDVSVVDGFDRAVSLLHHMTYPAALAAFQAVTREDPACALGYWGAAMTLFQPLWPNRPSPDDLLRGWQLAQQARGLVEPGGRESMFVATAEAFFSPEGEPDYWARIGRWSVATSRLFAANPDDREARAFFALSHLAGASLGDAATHHEEAAAVLLTILAEEPTHPGAVHYLIHANDFSGREHESLDVVRRYGQIAPANAHALHMPTHIFVRLGEWGQVVEWNRRAATAALRQRVGPAGEYVWDEYPHAIEYMVYAELQRADDHAAQQLIRALDETPDLQPTFKTAFHIASTAVRYAIEPHDWPRAVELTVPTDSGLSWESFPWPEALIWFGRGLGATHVEGADAVVEESLTHLTDLSRSPAAQAEPIFARQIEILRMEVAAWQAFAAGDRERAVRELEEVATLEERSPKHPVTPGPLVPARELLGEMYLAMQNPRAALDAYRAADAHAPGRFNTILGMARASAMAGDADAGRGFYRRLLNGTVSSSTRVGVAEAWAYVTGP
jgi:tetratricopeptide (TPR) repeat protein